MAISLAQLNRVSAPKPPRILIHGVAGVGKTTHTSTPTIIWLSTSVLYGTL